MSPIIEILIRVPVVYAILLLLVRVTGKRDIGQLCPEDFAVTLIIGDLLDNLFFGQTAMVMGVTALATLVTVHGGLSWASWRSIMLNRLLGSDPTRLVAGGAPDPNGLRDDRFRLEDLKSLLRTSGEEGPERIQEAYLETNGEFSVLLKSKERPATKRELRTLERLLG